MDGRKERNLRRSHITNCGEKFEAVEGKEPRVCELDRFYFTILTSRERTCCEEFCIVRTERRIC